MSEIAYGTRALILRHLTPFLVIVALLTATGTGADTVFAAQTWLDNLVSAVASFVALAAINRRVLAAERMMPSGGELQVAHLLGLCFLTKIGIGFGLLLLFVPGLYLAARWSISVPLLYAEDMDVGAAMGASAERVRPHVWSIVGLFLLLYLPGITVVLGVAMFEDVLSPLLADFITNLSLYGTMVIGWYLAIALYAALGQRQDHLVEVFA